MSKGQHLYEEMKRRAEQSELAGEPDPQGWRADVRSLLASRETLEECLRAAESRERNLVSAVLGLSKVKDGKTLFEGSPIKDPECCAAWERLNAAMQACGHVVKFLTEGGE